MVKADGVLFVTTLIATAGWIFSKESLAGLPPLLFIGTRFLLAGVLLGVLSMPQLRELGWAQLRRAFLSGALFSAAMAFWILGLAHCAHMGEGAFIVSLGEVLVPVLARLLFRERPALGTWLALPVSLAGFGLLLLPNRFQVEPGQLWFLVSALLFALLYNVNSHVLHDVPVRALSAIQMFVVGLLVLPVALCLEAWPESVAPAVLGWFAASVLIATTLRFFLLLYGQSLTSPSHAALILMLEPMFTAWAAAWWYGETMSGLQMLGCLLIFLALLISRWHWLRSILQTKFPAG
jgi:drug/metabolite transporter (DMT)-like permease